MKREKVNEAMSARYRYTHTQTDTDMHTDTHTHIHMHTHTHTNTHAYTHTYTHTHTCTRTHTHQLQLTLAYLLGIIYITKYNVNLFTASLRITIYITPLFPVNTTVYYGPVSILRIEKQSYFSFI